MTLRAMLAACLLACAAPCAIAVECIVPAKPGGGMDAACKMLRRVLKEEGSQAPVKLSYLPGGIGAVAWSSVVSQRRGGPDTLVTFSGGSLLNLAPRARPFRYKFTLYFYTQALASVFSSASL
jgi:putative tricarboxylic transport membrane protein